MHRFAGIQIRAIHTPDVYRARHEVGDSIQQLLHADVTPCGAAQHRHHRHVDGRLAQRIVDLLRLDATRILEETLQQVVVILRNRLNQRLAPFEGISHEILRHRDLTHVLPLRVRLIGPLVGLHLDEIHQSHIARLAADGDLDRHWLRAEALAHLEHHREKVGPHAIHLVHERQLRHAVLIGLAPHRFALGLHTAHGAEHGHRPVQDAQRTLHLHGEVHVPWGVDDVHLVGFPLACPEGGGSRRRNGDTALLLLHHPVHRGRPLVRLADLVRLPRVEEDTLSGRRFARIDVGHDAYVPRQR